MALDPSALADKLYNALGPPTDKDGHSITTAMMKAYANGYCACLQAGLVNNAPGTVQATALSVPGPIEDGEASNGLMVLVPSIMSGIVLPAYPPEAAPMLQAENVAVITYVMAAGRVSFEQGDIEGAGTNTPLTPGAITLGEGSGGTIGSLDGDTCASLVEAALGTPGPLYRPFYEELMNYTMDNAEVTYAPGTIEGVCPAGGGPITGGTGAGGTIA